MSSSNLWILFILAFQMARNIKSIETSTTTTVITTTTTATVSPLTIGTTTFSSIQHPDTSNTRRTSSVDHMKCGGLVTETRGILQTPNFPNKFTTPISCVWIIDGSHILSPNISIVVYLTQLYVLSGLKFTEYMYYSEDYKVPSQNVIVLREENVTSVEMLRFSSPYLEIKFQMDNLHGSHLRVLDRLLDVYGFNITYEVIPDNTGIKKFQCNTKKCSFLGHCYAASNFTSYYCSCFKGFTGKDCGTGPLCKDSKMLNYCENGGTCKHVGDASVTCICPPGFKGNKCHIPTHEELTSGGCNAENPENCYKQCSPSGQIDDNVCECTSNIVSSNSNRGKARYEATIRLATSEAIWKTYNYNTTLLSMEDGELKRLRENLPSILERHISRFLRNFNITKINDLEVFTKSPSGTDITFQFFGAKSDGTKVREAINRMVERGRLGNFSLVPTYLIFRQEPGVLLQSVVLNQRSAVREGSEFILSCVAQGSSKMMFRWYKNGYFVNVSRATRNMWTRLLPLDFKDHYTALLGVSKASKLDEGIYTCQVTDWGMQQCQSQRVYVQGLPKLQVYPSSATIYRGKSLRVRCLSTEGDATSSMISRHGTVGYSWTKNGALFQSDSTAEMWEDLYPDGSILKVQNVQKSVEYTCVVSNTIGTASSSVHVTVVDHGVVELCPEEETYGMVWLASAPGAPIVADCPGYSVGQVTRICEKRDSNKSEWLIPDFSNCISKQLYNVYNEFRGLTYGYQKTNGSAVLKSCLEYTMNRQFNFLPGEGGFLLRLLYEVFDYVKMTGSLSDLENAAEIVFRIADIVLGNAHSINNQEQIKEFQNLIQTALHHYDPSSILSASTSSSSTSSLLSKSSINSFNKFGSANQNLNLFRIFSSQIKSLPFNLQINGDQLFSDNLFMEISSTNSLSELISNGTFQVTAVSYKNLSNFLPRVYFSRNSLSEDVDSILASRVLSVWLFNSNRNSNDSSRPFNLPINMAHIEIIFEHKTLPSPEWNPLCGYDSKATYESSWRTDLCVTENLVGNKTKCVCPFSGTFVILLTKKNYNTSTPHISNRPMFVIISCGCCFIQTCIAFIILLPVFYINKSCITFLKMQFCTATSATMAIFILGLLKLLPKEWNNFACSSLTTLLLLGSSTLIAITLVVQSELSPRRNQTSKGQQKSLSSSSSSSLSSHSNNIAYIIKSAIGLSWLFPILCALCVPMVHSIIEYRTPNWWLEYGTFGFVLFIVIEILFVILFCLLFIPLIKKLFYLAKKHDKYNTSILKRIGLLYRIAVMLFIKIASDMLYLVNMNADEFILKTIFGMCNAVLGFSILFCFVIKAEIKLQLKSDMTATKNKGCAKKNLDENFCSGSINSPLSFFTNQEIEKDNESGPPITKIPLNMLPTAHHPHHTIERMPSTTIVETFLVSVPTNSSSSILTTVQQQQQQQQHRHELDLAKSIDSYNLVNFNQNNSHCFDITNNPSNNVTNFNEIEWRQQQIHLSSANQSQQIHGLYSDGYNNQMGGKLNLINETSNEFVGVGGLDILQGVSQDSIIGIRANAIDLSSKQQKNRQLKDESISCPNNMKSVPSSHLPQSIVIASPPSSLLHQQHTTSKTIPVQYSTQQSIHTHPTSNQQIQTQTPQPFTLASATSSINTIITATTSSSQSPQLPSSSSSQPSDLTNQNTQPPIITITTTEDGDAIDGMLDRISHDLDYLLNRTAELPVLRHIVNKQTTGNICGESSTASSTSSISSSTTTSSTGGGGGGTASSSSTSSSSQIQTTNIGNQSLGGLGNNMSVHEVIMEEAEE